MPKEYDKCVESYEHKGMSDKKAKSICAAAYYEERGMTVQQAKERGIDEDELVAILENDGIRERKNQVLLEMPLGRDIQILEEPKDGSGDLRFEGTALIDNVMSSNRRFYSEEFNDRALAMTSQFMENGGTVTMYSRHARATGGFLSAGEGLPIGQITELFRKNDRIRYRAEIYPTSEGADAAILLRRGAIQETSIRSMWFRSRLVKDDDTEEIHEEMIDAIIQGIDLAEEAGIEGAGIDKIYEEAPSFAQLSTIELQEEVTSMTDALKELTLEELKEQRPDLFDAMTAVIQEALAEEPPPEDNDTEIETEEANAPLEEHNKLVALVEGLTGQVEGLELEVAIQKASHIGASRQIAEALAKEVTTVEEIAEKLPAVKEAALTAFLEGAKPKKGDADGESRFETEDETSEVGERERKKAAEGGMSEEAKAVVRYAGGTVPADV